jgi:hypothetical protein
METPLRFRHRFTVQNPGIRVTAAEISNRETIKGFLEALSVSHAVLACLNLQDESSLMCRGCSNAG